MLKNITFGAALNTALRQEMRRNDKVYCIGEDVGLLGGTFGVTKGLRDEFGELRCLDTPISESMIVGSCVGAAAVGMVPVAEIMFADFVASCFDQLLNQAAKMRYMYGGNIKLPMVVYMANGGGIQASAQHSQSVEGFLTHIPGLKVVYPSNAADAAGLMVASIRDENPVVFMNHKKLGRAVGDIEDVIEPIPLGKAAIKKEGTDVTLLATGFYVNVAMSVAAKLEEEGVSVEVIDPRTLYPLDTEAIYNSVKKTKKFVVVTEECKRGAWSAEVASLVAEHCFDDLEKKVVRIGALNVPSPYTSELESYALPSEADIINGIKSIL